MPSEQTSQTLPVRGDRFAPAAEQRSPWLVSPAFDLAFFANVAWVLAFLPGFLSAERAPHIEFWQVYFLTTPHRWITLVLVAADPDRAAAGRGSLPRLPWRRWRWCWACDWSAAGFCACC